MSHYIRLAILSGVLSVAACVPHHGYEASNIAVDEGLQVNAVAQGYVADPITEQDLRTAGLEVTHIGNRGHISIASRLLFPPLTSNAYKDARGQILLARVIAYLNQYDLQTVSISSYPGTYIAHSEAKYLAGSQAEKVLSWLGQYGLDARMMVVEQHDNQIKAYNRHHSGYGQIDINFQEN